MLKTIAAALLATSVIAAPAFAAEAGKTTTAAPVIKADQSQTKPATTAAKPEAGVKADAKTDVKTTDAKASDVKTDAKVDGKSKAMDANAAVTTDEHKSVSKHRHHDKQVTAKESQKAQPDVTKPATSDKRN
ncbi:type IV secretory pathway TrbL component [Bradyrhizobium yuanmingense]|uniref:His-rich protein BRANT n=1 Tax=Bradyrhizobium yuanmingense TaxID=108015 RepID=UPI0035172F05